MAANTDLLKKLARKWVGQIGAAGVSDAVVTTIPLSSTTNLPTDTAVVAVIDRVDSNGTKTTTLEETVIGVVSGSNLINCVRGSEGTAQAHSAGAVVEILVTAKGWNDIVDWGLVQHGQTGSHTSALITQFKATGATINTGTDDATIVTPKAIEDSNLIRSTDKATATENVTGTDDAKYLTALANVPAFNNSLYRQAIINGNFDVWQRGTSVAMTAANAYAADRWYCETATAGTDKTVSQQDGTGVNGSYYCARVAMVQDVDELLTFSQALESQDSIKFRGKKVTLSFYARGGAEFVADNSTLVSKIVTGKGTDQKVLAFTTSADAVSQNNTLTTGWVKFTCTTSAVIASDITQIGVSFAFTHAGSGTTTNYFEITQVQLCAGDVALPFMPKSFEEELRACQRYYEKSYEYGAAPGATSATGIMGKWTANTYQFYDGTIRFLVPKRTTGYTVYYYSYSTGTVDKIRNFTDSSDLAFTNAANALYKTNSHFQAEANNTLTASKLYYIHWAVDNEL